MRFPVLKALAPLVVLLLLAACTTEAPTSSPEPEQSASAPATREAVEGPSVLERGPDEAQQRAALNDALHTYEQLIETLRAIGDPITAWNEGANAALLIRELEDNQETFALRISPEEAQQRYPEQMRRLVSLEEAYRVELMRIQEDPIAWQVLLEEILDSENG